MPKRWRPAWDRILGKAQLEDVPFYLIRDNNQSFYEAQWISGIEAYQKLHWMIVEYDRRKLKYLKSNWYFIDEQILQNLLTEFAEKEVKNGQKRLKVNGDSVGLSPQVRTKMRAKSEQLKKLFLKKFQSKKQLWDSSIFEPLQINLAQHRPKPLNYTVKKEFADNHQNQIQTFCRPELSIDYDTLNLNNRHSTHHFIDCELIFGRLIVSNHRLYLVKKNQETLQASRWMYCHEPMTKYRFSSIFDKMKRISMKAKHLEVLLKSQKNVFQEKPYLNRSAQLCFYVDKERIDYEILKENFLQLKYFCSLNSLLEINQKDFYEETKEIQRIFMKEAEQVRSLIQQKFGNHSTEIIKEEQPEKGNSIIDSAKVEPEQFEPDYQQFSSIHGISLNFGNSSNDETVQIEESEPSKKLNEILKNKKSQSLSKQLQNILCEKIQETAEFYFSSDDETSEYEYEWLDDQGFYCCEIGGLNSISIDGKIESRPEM